LSITTEDKDKDKDDLVRIFLLLRFFSFFLLESDRVIAFSTWVMSLKILGKETCWSFPVVIFNSGELLGSGNSSFSYWNPKTKTKYK